MDSDLVRAYKTYSPQTKITSFLTKPAPTYKDIPRLNKQVMSRESKTHKAIINRYNKITNLRTDSEKLPEYEKFLNQVDNVVLNNPQSRAGSAKTVSFLQQRRSKLVHEYNTLLDKKINELKYRKGSISHELSKADKILQALNI